MLCVYALTSGRSGRIGVRGMAGEPLRLMTVGRVAAITGEIARRPAATLARARAYDDVVRALAAGAQPILPARFGTCFRSFDDLELVLRTRERALARALSAVRGRVQMIVRMPDSSTDERGVPPATAGGAASGTEYLRARAADAARERRVPGFEPIRETARRWIKDEAVEKRGRVASVYHLIPRASARAYAQAIRRAAAERGVRVVVTGPMPAYAFAQAWLAPGSR
jgi:hypothetical protein